MSAVPTTTTDAADEAGGEAIFSSDGLAPLPAPTAPLAAISGRSSQQQQSLLQKYKDEDADVLDSTPSLLDPSEASQRYASASSSLLFNSRQQSPQVRLWRLQQELSSLEQELKREGQEEEKEQLSKQASALAERLDRALVSSQEELASILQKNLTPSPADGDDEKKKAKASSIETTADVSSLTSLEQRLVRLEGVLGASGQQQQQPSSVLERVERMENLVKRIDNKSLEEAATKAKVIRADLEAASKARAKLSSSNSSSSSSSSKDSQRIVALHDQLQEVEGLSAHLPALAHRLQQLASLHAQGATFATRLATAEQLLGTTQTTLQQLEQAVAQVEGGMLQNAQVMEQNVQQLGKRIEQL